MANTRVEVDDKAVRALFADWDGPVGEAIATVTDEIEVIAEFLAPVSVKGSVFSPPGHLKEFTRKSLERHTGDDGFVLGLVGAPRFPYDFVATPKSHLGTLNRGRKSRRRPDNYLRTAEESIPFERFEY
jgi:hypothetical protein